MASNTLEETLQRLNVSAGTTFPATLFRSKASGKLLFLEAGKDFVDVLLSFLHLPVGNIIQMLTTGMKVKPPAIGISSIFGSMQKLSASDLQVDKAHLLRPRPAAIGCNCRSTNLGDASILPSPNHRGFYGNYHICGSFGCRSSVATSINHRGFWGGIREVDLSSVGFVKAKHTFIVTDNLESCP